MAVAFFAVALVFGAAGHAGASGYLAVMALADMAPERMKPLALGMNVLVAAIGTWNFRSSGEGRGRALAALLAGSVPMAWLGGSVATGGWYRPLLGVLLGLSAVRLLVVPGRGGDGEPARVPTVPAVACGAVIGALAGLTGTGGGVFLTPVLLLAGWASPRQAAAITAPFILANSLAGLLGAWRTVAPVAPALLGFGLVAAAGGALGSWLGAHRLPERPLRAWMAAVLLFAAARNLGS